LGVAVLVGAIIGEALLLYLGFIWLVRVSCIALRDRYRPPRVNSRREARIASLVCAKYDTPKPELLESLRAQSDVYVLTGGRTKAEAINEWVRENGWKYDFVGIFDWDSEVPRDFYERILGYFDDRTAFVQAKILGRRGFLREEVAGFFENRLPIYFLSCGHNVVYRAEVLTKHPMPNGMGEDFIHSIELFELGYRSVLADDVISYEDSPAFKKFLEREVKWSGLEVRYMALIPRLLRCRIPLLKRLEIFADLTRRVTSAVILLGLIAFPLEVYEQAVGLVLGLIATRPRTLKSVVAIPMLTFSFFGLLRGLFVKADESIPTSHFSASKTVYGLAIFNVLLSLVQILRGVNVLVFSLILALSIIWVGLLVREHLRHSARWPRR
jgi:cellulose synthase/poly-beta-1,6-N-acetylglucosamine synthase-like glycosyltransferase